MGIRDRHTDGSYLLTRRDPRKHYGGLWEATAGGSALRGETPLDCARRELREETGIRAEELRELGRVRSANTHYVEFLCETDWPKDGVTLQDVYKRQVEQIRQGLPGLPEQRPAGRGLHAHRLPPPIAYGGKRRLSPEISYSS